MSDAEESQMNESLESFAASLSSLTPRSSEVNRDRLMYEAGRAAALKGLVAGRSGVRFWKFTTALSTVAAACFAMLSMQNFGVKPETVVQQKVDPAVPMNVVREAEEMPEAIEVAAAPVRPLNSSYLSQRNLVLSEGVDSLPRSPALQEDSSFRAATYRELLNSLDEVSGFGG